MRRYGSNAHRTAPHSTHSHLATPRYSKISSTESSLSKASRSLISASDTFKRKFIAPSNDTEQKSRETTGDDGIPTPDKALECRRERPVDYTFKTALRWCLHCLSARWGKRTDVFITASSRRRGDQQPNLYGPRTQPVHFRGVKGQRMSGTAYMLLHGRNFTVNTVRRGISTSLS